MDEAGAWATGLGTIIHEALQDCIGRKFPSAKFEVPSKIEDVSGSCDALIAVSDFEFTGPWEVEFDRNNSTHVLYELKTMGTYSFDKQVGWNRMRAQVNGGEGPAMKAIAQAGMNAIGIMAADPNVTIEWLVMGSITFEALSKNKAASMGVDGTNRFLAEYYIPRHEWQPLANQELSRMRGLGWALDNGYLPDRVAIGDNGQVLELNPDTGKAWQCDYCAFRSACSQDGEGQIRLIDSVLTQPKEGQ
jgi:hypothetical protein